MPNIVRRRRGCRPSERGADAGAARPHHVPRKCGGHLAAALAPWIATQGR